MKVYQVTLYWQSMWDRDPEQILGTFSTKEKAKEYETSHKEMIDRLAGYPSSYIREIEVDGPGMELEDFYKDELLTDEEWAERKAELEAEGE